MSGIPGLSQGTGPKGFWKRPEGKLGMVFVAVIGVAAAMLLNKLLPMIIIFMQNGITAAILALIALLLLYIVTNRQVRLLASTVFKLITKWLTGMVIELDPINILNIYIDKLNDNLAEMGDHREKLKGHIRALQNKMVVNADEAQRLLETAAEAKKRGKDAVMRLSARHAARLQESNNQYKKLLVKMEFLYRLIGKMYEVSQFILEDLNFEVKVKKDERNMILAAHGAMKSAMSIIRGNPDERAMFDQAMEFVTQDYGEKLGQIEDMMESSRSIIETVDLHQGVFEEKALRQLEELEKSAERLIIVKSEDVKLISQTSSDDAQPLDFSEILPTVSSDPEEVKVRASERTEKAKAFSQLFPPIS